VLGAVAAVALVLGAVIALYWRDAVLWMRLRGVRQVYIHDMMLGEHVVESRAAVAGAVRETIRFILSIEPKPRADVEKVGYLSEVIFVSGAARSDALALRLNSVDEDERVVIEFCGALYRCDRDAWYRYLKKVLSPLAPSLEAAWRSRKSDQELDAAAALLLVAPETEGLIDALCRAASETPQALGVLAICSDEAPRIAECLEALIAPPGTPADGRGERDGAAVRK